MVASAFCSRKKQQKVSLYAKPFVAFCATEGHKRLPYKRWVIINLISATHLEPQYYLFDLML